MPTAYRIVNWPRYETADARKCATMRWVAVPIEHTGLGYIEIMSRPDGVRTIGGWLLILQIAAQCPTRGLLVSDSGRILGAREIALKVRAPEQVISDCLATLLEFGWIEEIDVSGSHPDAFRTPSGLQDRTLQDRTGQEKTGGGGGGLIVNPAREISPPPSQEKKTPPPPPPVGIASSRETMDRAMAMVSEQAKAVRDRPLPARKVAFPDFRAMHPSLRITQADGEAGEALWRLYPLDCWQAAMAALGPEAKRTRKPIYLSLIRDWFAAHVTLDASDYQAAGLPIPEELAHGTN